MYVLISIIKSSFCCEVNGLSQCFSSSGSENDRPDIFPDSQLYVVLEFGHGGRDLESFVFNNARDLMAVFLQVS